MSRPATNTHRPGGLLYSSPLATGTGAEDRLTARQEAQRQLDAALSAKKHLEYQRSQLNRRSQLYALRAGGFDMQIAQAQEDIHAAQAALALAEASDEV